MQARAHLGTSWEDMMPDTMGTSNEGAVLLLPLIVVETGTPTR